MTILEMRVERRVERRDEPGYWYTATVAGPDGEYTARVYGDRLVDLVDPTGAELRLVPFRRGHRLIGPDGRAAASFLPRRRGVTRLLTAGAVVEFRVEDDRFQVVQGGRLVGSVTADPRRTPAADCFDAHGRRLAPIFDWVLHVEPGGVPTEVWAAALVVLDDRHPTVALGA